MATYVLNKHLLQLLLGLFNFLVLGGSLSFAIGESLASTGRRTRALFEHRTGVVVEAESSLLPHVRAGQLGLDMTSRGTTPNHQDTIVDCHTGLGIHTYNKVTEEVAYGYRRIKRYMEALHGVKPKS